MFFIFRCCWQRTDNFVLGAADTGDRKVIDSRSKSSSELIMHNKRKHTTAELSLLPLHLVPSAQLSTMHGWSLAYFLDVSISVISIASSFSRLQGRDHATHYDYLFWSPSFCAPAPKIWNTLPSIHPSLLAQKFEHVTTKLLESSWMKRSLNTDIRPWNTLFQGH